MKPLNLEVLDQSNNLISTKQIAKIVLRNWYLYIGSLIIGIWLAHSYKKSVDPVYEIKSKVLIKEESNRSSDAEDWLSNLVDNGGRSENFLNEVQIMSSFSAVRDVVKNLGINREYYVKEGKRLKKLYDGKPFIVDSCMLRSEESYGRPFMVEFQEDGLFKLYQDTLLGSYCEGDIIENKYGTFRIKRITDYPFPEPLFFKIYKEETYALRLQDKLHLELSDENASVVNLTYKDDVPSRGVDFLTGLLSSYSRMTSRESEDIKKNTLAFIDTRLEDVASQLKSTEYNLESYKRSNKIAGETNSDVALVYEKINQLSEERQNYNLKAKLVKSTLEKLTTDETKFELLSPSNEALGNDIADIVQPYNQLVLEKNRLLESAESSHPVINSMDGKLRELRNTIKSTLENKEEEIKYRLEVIDEENNNYTQRLTQSPQNERRIIQIERDKSIVEDLYTYMLKKREETALSMIARTSKITVIDLPYSSEHPVAPNGKVIYLTAFMLSLALPLSLQLIRKANNSSISTEEEIRVALPDMKIIGAISKANVKENQLVVSNGDSWITERFKNLRMNLQMIGSRRQTILVTSSVSTEGKTFIALNLAFSFAKARKKTILIDLDFRKPKMSTILGREKKKGLSDYLSGNTKYKNIIHKTDLHHNLDYITCGLNPTASEEILDESILRQLFTSLRNEYDIIVVDSAPIGVVSDALIMRKFTDQTLFVVRAGVTQSEVLMNSKEFLDRRKLQNPSIVFNESPRVNRYGKSYYKNYAS